MPICFDRRFLIDLAGAIRRLRVPPSPIAITARIASRVPVGTPHAMGPIFRTAADFLNSFGCWNRLAFSE